MVRSFRGYSDKAFEICVYILFLFVIFVTLYPFWNLAAISLNDPQDSLRGGIYFWPREFTFVSYYAIFRNNARLVQGVVNSVLRTGIGTVLNVACGTLVAYALSRKDYILRRFMNKFVFFTMYITAGLIPIYLLYHRLGLINNFAVYILPHLLHAYIVVLLRTYIQDLSPSLTEAAIIDGASDSAILFKIIIPLSVPVIATVSLFIAVFQWGQWQDTFFFASNPKAGLTTLQYEMTKIIRESNVQYTEAQLRDMQNHGGPTATPESLQAAMTIIATVPILLVYPFLQKYFISGITLGAVKE